MARIKLYKISELARISGISIRTLHHYDAIGLLKPADRSGAGYRLYDAGSALRLQQILIQKSLGFSLEHIRRVLDDPDFDVADSLKAQLTELEKQAKASVEMIRCVKAALDRIHQERLEFDMTMKEIFDGFDPSMYEAEVEERWADTDAYRESARRTARYTVEEWQIIKAEQDDIFRDAATALAGGLSPTDDEVIKIAERHRQHIDRWYYACSPAMHACLADLWEADDRFRQSIDAYGTGVTRFLASIVRGRTG